MVRFCFPFCSHVATVCSLHWSGGHYSIYRSPHKLHPASLKWQPAKPVLTEPWNALNWRENLPSKIKWSWTLLLPLKEKVVPWSTVLYVHSWYATLIIFQSYKNTSKHSEWSDPTLGDWVNPWLRSKKLLLILAIIILICVFSYRCLYYCHGIWLWCSQITAKQATSTLVRPLADYSGHTVRERLREVVRVNLQR